MVVYSTMHCAAIIYTLVARRTKGVAVLNAMDCPAITDEAIKGDQMWQCG